MYDSDTIFISEKTYKPIYLCQPFVIFGNPFTLNKLHELGYKTFDRWWDESYDTETDLKKRFDKILSILEMISELSLDELQELKNEMQHVLIHNYLHFFENTELQTLLKNLQCDVNTKSLL